MEKRGDSTRCSCISLRPDLVLSSRRVRRIAIAVLRVASKARLEETCQRTMGRYAELLEDIRWMC